MFEVYFNHTLGRNSSGKHRPIGHQGAAFLENLAPAIGRLGILRQDMRRRQKLAIAGNTSAVEGLLPSSI